jgi:hypothetical protein
MRDYYGFKGSVQIATEKDIVVYDSKASPGVFTERLIELADSLLSRIHDPEKGYIWDDSKTATHIYVGSDCLLDHGEFMTRESRSRLTFVRRELWDGVETFYKDILEGAFAPNDKRIALFLREEDGVEADVLLGSF